ncbi:Lysophospholipase L1 [Propionispira arboris]|uniref:Lysophospholipase L1 n=1 Tax=Propionispira arboris TaxID=84035 RepID=A0A1H6ZD77_9FIRM|nr:GDSL-type esterase/lipase family protein [Propionispira arboris]SEJ51381.1 Lysophospholipase L1 [Propionispira arboris]
MKKTFRKSLCIVLGCSLVFFIFTRNTIAEGGWKKVENKFYSQMDDLSRSADTPAYLSLHYRIRKLYFEMDTHALHPVVFLGDSMTDEGKWHQLFPNVNLVNRGIGGDTTLGVLNRIDQIIALAPPKIFLMIGTNDLCFNRSIPDTIKNYDQILAVLHKALPQTKIYIESVLPFNDNLFPSRYLRNNENISSLNVGIKKLAEKYQDPYIDMVKVFSDKNGRLPAEDTVDGLHLNEKGYLIWRNQIQNLVI